ncbi:hypothetical protein CRG98_011761 [Punica granatum]|uniref:Uncharacterized protein n=1 Tax=Punica granatum TaxID=22663 RepID=A0A2I0KH62_PUNGR|nr:hypothetical protein CRG98_011761 [Punica granatum]
MAALRTLTRSLSRRRCGAQRAEPPLSAARRRPCYRPIATNGLWPIAFHCRSSPSAQPAQPVSRDPKPFAAQAQSVLLHQQPHPHIKPEKGLNCDGRHDNSE